MTAPVTLIDYGAGNLLSVARAVRHLGVETIIAETPAAVAAARRLILPGVGAFAACMGALSRNGLEEAVRRSIASGNPLLGICVGMQLLFEGSDEFGDHAGLGLLPGRVRAIPSGAIDGRQRKVPHIGWNSLRPASGNGPWRDGLLAGVTPGESVYFVHSFVAEPENEPDLAAICEYEGIRLAAVVQRDNLHGCQFHPEKSGPLGLRILKNFLDL